MLAQVECSQLFLSTILIKTSRGAGIENSVIYCCPYIVSTYIYTVFSLFYWKMINIFPFQVKVDKLEALEDVSSNKVMRNKILQILVPFTDEKL